MKLHNHLQLSCSKNIITLANKGHSRYKIHQLTGISKGKIRRCLNSCENITRKPNLSKPWKGPRIIKKYSFKTYQNQRDQRKLNGAYKYSNEAEKVYLLFINFVQSFIIKKYLM